MLLLKNRRYRHAEFIEHHTNIGGETGMCLAKLGTGAGDDRFTKLKSALRYSRRLLTLRLWYGRVMQVP